MPDYSVLKILHMTAALLVVGGILLAPVLIMLVLPVLIDRFSRHRAPN